MLSPECGDIRSTADSKEEKKLEKEKTELAELIVIKERMQKQIRQREEGIAQLQQAMEDSKEMTASASTASASTASAPTPEPMSKAKAKAVAKRATAKPKAKAKADAKALAEEPMICPPCDLRPITVEEKAKPADKVGDSRQAPRSRRVKKRKAAVTDPKNTHNIFTQFPADIQNCLVCFRNKVMKARKSSKTDEGGPLPLPKPTAFGDMLISDHKILNEHDKSRSDDMVVQVIQDAFTYWLEAFPAKTKSAAEVKKAFATFLEF